MSMHQPKATNPRTLAPNRARPAQTPDISKNPAPTALTQFQAQATVSPANQGLQALQRAADARFAPVQRMEEEDLMQGKAIQRVEEEELLQGKTIQRMDEEELMQGKVIEPQAAQKKTNGTGLPEDLKSGMENLSGMSLDGVKVHRNSDKPAQVGAHAYAQGRNIHLASGQEKHLPHEAWHVVQQAQGRVKPTLQAKGVAINDDPGLETEADVMGAKALQMGAGVSQLRRAQRLAPQTALQTIVQARAPGMSGHAMAQPDAEAAEQGVRVTRLANSDYTSWSQTAQAKMAPHGACTAGSHTIVTQYQLGQNPVQLGKIREAVDFVKANALAFAVIGEGVLTAIAGTVAIGVTAAAAPLSLPLLIAAIMTTGVGVSKIIRGSLMLCEKTDTKVKIMDGLRAFEAVMATVGGAFAGNPGIVIFGILKALRSVVMLIQHNEERKVKPDPWTVKGLKMLASVLHVLEVAALAVGGGTMIAGGIDAGSGAKILGGVAAGAVAVSKTGRAAVSVKEAAEPPTV